MKYSTSRPTFRFHTGSIKSLLIHSVKHPKLLFRFHTGSIKSGTVILILIPAIMRFDSILVRLKATFYE